MTGLKWPLTLPLRHQLGAGGQFRDVRLRVPGGEMLWVGNWMAASTPCPPGAHGSGAPISCQHTRSAEARAEAIRDKGSH